MISYTTTHNTFNKYQDLSFKVNYFGLMFEGKPFYKKLEDDLALKSVSSMEDVERLMELHLLVFEGEPSVARLLKALILDHPYTKPE